MTRARSLAALLGVGFVCAVSSACGGDEPAVPGPAKATPAPAAAVVAPISFGILAAADERVSSEPCTRHPGGGLLSMPAFFDRASQHLTPFVRMQLGDVTRATGELGGLVASFRYREMVAQCGTTVVAAGPGDLALGTEFIRGVLASGTTAVLCANAADARGSPILRGGWVLLDAEKQTVLVLASASSALQAEISSAGSDVRLLDERAAVTAALASGNAAARAADRTVAATVLLHHGTLDETAELVRVVPGLSFAVAARGRALPQPDPRLVGDVPVFESGRGARFGWILTVDRGRPVRWKLERIGVGLMAAGSPLMGTPQAEAELVREGYFTRVARGEDTRPEDVRGTYVGAARCIGCHPDQGDAHGASAHARLPASYPDRGLGSTQCLQCHVTGAFSKTGWKGPGDRTDLAGVSCEACHGPGSSHVEKPASGWGAVGLAACRRCHTVDRSPQFDAAAVWKQSGHGAR